jgi:lactoylglutathione lyase
VPEVSSIVLYSAQAERTIAFYRLVGIDFEDEDHGDGMVHAATDLGDVHVAVFPASHGGTAPARRGGGSTFVGFYVDSMDETLAALAAFGPRIVVDHEVQQWGCRVVIEDPDGRPVEINQRAHCSDTDTV